MQGILQIFISDLDKLLQLIKSLEKEEQRIKTFKYSLENVKSNLDPTLKELYITLIKEHTNLYVEKKEFNYKGVIISLYGYFEKFIESIVEQYVKMFVSLYPLYRDVPEKIKKTHYDLSLDLLNKIKSSNYGGGLNANDILKNMLSCSDTNTESFSLNLVSFSIHTSNFRHSEIMTLFTRLGTNGLQKKLGQNSGMVHAYLEQTGQDLPPHSNLSIVFSILDTIVEKRNDVAHGVELSIVSTDILSGYIEYVFSYAYTLVEVLEQLLLNEKIKINGIPLGKANDIFNEGKVICINNQHHEISKGDTLYAKSIDEIFSFTVKNIQLNNVDILKSEKKKDCEIGLLVDKKVKRNTEIFIIA